MLRIPVAPIGNGENIPTMDHFVERGVFVKNPGAASCNHACPIASPAIRPGPSRARTIARAARRARSATNWPAVGSDELRHRGHGDRRARRAPDDEWPLAGVRVVDMTAFWAGPYATYTLACLGADVIHVESVQRPDGMRFGAVRPPSRSTEWWEWGPTFHSANAGKRSITLDLTRDDGRRVVAAAHRTIRRAGRELLAARDGAVRPHLGRRPRVEPASGDGAHARLRSRRTVARPRRLRADDGTGFGHGVAHRLRRHRTDERTRSVRPAGRAPLRVQRARRPAIARAHRRRYATSRRRWSRPRSTRPPSRSSNGPAHGTAVVARRQPPPRRRAARRLHRRRSSRRHDGRGGAVRRDRRAMARTRRR